MASSHVQPSEAERAWHRVHLILSASLAFQTSSLLTAGWEWKVSLLTLNTKEGWSVDGLSRPSVVPITQAHS